MNQIWKTFIKGCILLFPIVSFANTNQNYLKNKIPEGNIRFVTFQYILNEMNAREVKTIIETGTSRMGKENCLGDGCSTCIFSAWAYDHGATLYSVDISENALQSSSNALGEERNCVVFVQSDSVEFLKSFDDKIDFLYLDSYDFEVNNPFPSQLHHLHEIEAALPYLHENSIVMIDDCRLPHGGKGSLVIKFLKMHGWKVVMDEYQVILVK